MAATSETHRRSAEWDIRSGGSNYLALVGAQVVSSAAAFAIVWLTTRLLGAEGYGRVAAVIAATQLVMQVALNWTQVSLARYGCEEFVKVGRIADTFWTRTLILIPNLLAVLATSPWWMPRLAAWLKISPDAQPLVIAYLLVSALWLHVQHALQAAKLQRLQGILFAAERGLTLLALLALALFGKVTLIMVMSAYVVSAAAASLAGLWQLRALIRPVGAWERPLLRRMLRFSLPLVPSVFAGYLLGNHLDAVFIARYLTLADLGVYSVAYLVVGNFLQLPTLASLLLLPLFVSLRADGRERAVARFFREINPLLVLGWSLACALAAAACSYLLPLVFGPQYRQAAELVWPLMAMAAMSGPVLLGFGAVSNAWSATHISLVAMSLQGVANIALNFLLIPRFGLVGCAWASALSCGASLLVWAYFISRRVPAAGLYSAVATLPAVAGAAQATWQKDILGALAVAVFTFGLILFWQRRSLMAGARSLLAKRIIPVPKPLRRSEAL